MNCSNSKSDPIEKKILPFGYNSFFLRAKIISRNKIGKAETVADLPSKELIKWIKKRPREESSSLLETLQNIVEPKEPILGFARKKHLIRK